MGGNQPMKKKNIYIIGGPNGSGKTTFARKFLPLYAHCPHFVNADLIAQGLSPFSPETAAIRAGRLVLEQIHSLAGKNLDFAFETTLSGKTYLSFLKRAKARGYALHLFFLWIPSIELALGRIKDRVASGGHNVPPEDVRRRFRRGVQNFFTIYKPILDSWTLLDNSRAIPYLIAQEKDGNVMIVDKILYSTLSAKEELP